LERWTRRGDFDYDLAVLQLQDDATTNQWVGYRHIPQPVGWMTMGFTEPFKVNKEYCTADFPGDKKTVHGQYMLYAQCRGGAVDQARTRILKTKFDSAQGQSGSSMYRARHPSKSGPDNGDHGTTFDDDIAGKIQGVLSTSTTYYSSDGRVDSYATVFVRVKSGRIYQICDWITRMLPAGVFNPCGSV
jgi:V8-like Glu-specific endopeptidase